MNRLQASFLGAFLAFGLAQAQAQPQQGPKQNMPDKGPAAAQVLPDFADLVEKYGPAVVSQSNGTAGTRPSRASRRAHRSARRVHEARNTRRIGSRIELWNGEHVSW